jgi:hypothetical protein
VTSKHIRSVAADSNVLLSAVVGKAARRVFLKARELVVVTTEANIREIEEHLPAMAERYGVNLDLATETLEALPIIRVPERDYIRRVAEARRYLEQRGS